MGRGRHLLDAQIFHHRGGRHDGCGHGGFGVGKKLPDFPLRGFELRTLATRGGQLLRQVLDLLQGERATLRLGARIIDDIVGFPEILNGVIGVRNSL